MTEKELRQKVATVAKGFLGLNEADGSHKEIIDLYNGHTPLPVGYKMTYTDAWCATFVSAVGIQSGLSGIIFPECSCPRMIELYKAAGRWEENDAHEPKVGDIIMYDWDDSRDDENTGTPDHVGIVVSVSGGKLKIIEGNISNKVGYRTISTNAKYIRGYCLPDYASVAGAEETKGEVEKEEAAKEVTVVENTPETGAISVILNELKAGSKGEQVKAMQSVLIGRGYRCGVCGVDGDFGSATTAAVRNFQRAEKLTVDGICGKNTWTKLLKG